MGPGGSQPLRAVTDSISGGAVASRVKSVIAGQRGLGAGGHPTTLRADRSAAYRNAAVADSSRAIPLPS